MQTEKKKDRFRVLRIIKNIVLTIVILFLTAVLVVSIISKITGNTPSLFGFSLYRVSSGSMMPELEIGEIILVQNCDGAEVQKGDIVSFVSHSGEMNGKIVTHRVVKSPYNENGEKLLVTKGDANSIEDAPMPVSRIKAKMIVKLPFLKWFFDFFATPWGLIALILLIILAFFNEILNVVKALFGVGLDTEPKESVDDLIARYQRENTEHDGNTESLSEDDDEKDDV